MSLSPADIMTYRELDPRLQFDDQETYVIPISGMDNTPIPIVSSQVSAANIIWSAPPPNQSVAMSRLCYMQVPFRLTFTGPDDNYQEFVGAENYIDNGVHLIQLGANDAPRSFGLSKSISSLKVQIDNSSESVDLDLMMGALERYMTNGDKAKYLSMCATSPSEFLNYRDYIDFGIQRNCLRRYGESALGSCEGNGSYTDITPVSGVLNPITNIFTETYDILFTEPLFISPMKWRDCNKALIGMQNFQVFLNFGNTQLLWSHSTAGKTINNMAVTVNPADATYGSAKLLVKYITPQPQQLINKLNVYGYEDVTTYVTSENRAINPNSTDTLRSNNLQLSVTPARIYIYAGLKPSEKTITDTDTFLTIQSLSILWNNKSSQLSQADIVQLYQISSQNGLQYGYGSWNKFVGSVMAVDFSKDLGLDPSDAPSRLKQGLLSVQCRVKNNRPDPITPSLFITTVSPGLLIKDSGKALFMTGVVSNQDLLNAPELNRMQRVNDYEYDGYGGNIFSGVKKVVDKGSKLLKKYGPTALKTAKTGIELGKRAFELGEEYGPEIATIIETLMGAGYSPSESKRMALSMHGGKLASKKTMNKRLQKY